MLMHGGRVEQAIAIWEKMAADFPEKADALYGLGTIYAQQGHYGTAIGLLMRATAVNPALGEVWSQLGTTLKAAQHRDEARFAYQRAIEIMVKNLAAARDDDARSLVRDNLGIAYAGYSGTYVNAGDPKRGIELAEKSLQYKPNWVHAINSLALCTLESGNWRRGWPLYEERARIPGYHVRLYGDAPRWEGEKTPLLAIHAEQGLGDEILFASCIPDVLAVQGKNVVFECAPRLLDLFRRSFDIPCYGTHQELWEAHGSDITAWDRLSSLPRLYRSDPSACPGLPFLKADPVKVAGYARRMEYLGPPPWVGIAWTGGTPGTHERVRNPPLAMFEKLVREVSGTVISLQYGAGARAVAKQFGIAHWPAAIDDLDEFAALIVACDKVISVCQTAVHFAGALGVPCVCLTPSQPAWRYGLTGRSMPWYRSVVLARQEKNDWTTAFAGAQTENIGLESLVA